MGLFCFIYSEYSRIEDIIYPCDIRMSDGLFFFFLIAREAFHEQNRRKCIVKKPNVVKTP